MTDTTISKVMTETLGKGGFDYTAEELEEAFPKVDPEFIPLGSRVIVQIRTPPSRIGSILLHSDVTEVELWNTQIGKVVATGPIAFHNRTTMEPWPEGAWAKVGDYVRIPKFNQDKWWIEYNTKLMRADGSPVTNKALFMLINDLDILAIKTGSPLTVKAYV